MVLVLAAEASESLPMVARHLGEKFFKRRFACVSTAAQPYPDRPWVALEQDCLKRLGAELIEVELSTLSPSEAVNRLDDSDGIYVHGGNTFFLLQEMQRVGFKDFARRYLDSGRPYVGSSAGTLVAAPRIDIISPTDDPQKAPRVDAASGLGFINFVPFVHFDVPSYAAAFRESFGKALELGVNVLPLRNDQCLISENGKFELLSGRAPRETEV